MIFWGTFFPLISEAAGAERSVGPPWFNRMTTPLALVLVLLMGIGPVVAWRRITLAGLRRALRRAGGPGRGRARRACWRSPTPPRASRRW